MLDLMKLVGKNSSKATFGIHQGKNSFTLSTFFQLGGHPLCGKLLLQIQKEWVVWTNICLVFLMILRLSQNIFIKEKH